MELHKISIKMTLVLATPDEHEPTKEEIAKVLKKEICTNGFLKPGKMKKAMITSNSEIPEGWEDSIPWPTKKRLNPAEWTISEILYKKSRK